MFSEKAINLSPLLLLLGFLSVFLLSWQKTSSVHASVPHQSHWAEETEQEREANARLEEAMANPEYLLKHWVNLPTTPLISSQKVQKLSLREAILLALRYNPNIQNAELDRITQRYQLRLAQNEFELHYALTGSAVAEKVQYQGLGSVNNNSALATPELHLKTKSGAQLDLNLANNVSNYNSLTPVLNVSVMQPLLRGFGRTVNEMNLRNILDNEEWNKLNLQQTISDQITQVIVAYRALVLSTNNLENQRVQLKEARHTFTINEKKIKAGQLERTANIQQAYQIESLSLMLEQANNEFHIAAQELLQAIGLDPKLRVAVPSDLPLTGGRIPTVKEALSLALQHNTAFVGQKLLLLADERAFQAAKNEQLWALNLGGTIQSGRVADVKGQTNGFSSIYTGQNTTQAAQLTLTIPIQDVTRRHQLINAKIKLEKDRLNLLTMKRVLETNVTNIIASLNSLSKRYLLAQKQVSLAWQSYQLEKKRFEAGIASALDVNNTQNQLIQAQTGRISAKIAYLNQLSALQRLLGTTLEVWQIKLRYGK